PGAAGAARDGGVVDRPQACERTPGRRRWRARRLAQGRPLRAAPPPHTPAWPAHEPRDPRAADPACRTRCVGTPQPRGAPPPVRAARPARRTLRLAGPAAPRPRTAALGHLAGSPAWPPPRAVRPGGAGQGATADRERFRRAR